MSSFEVLAGLPGTGPIPEQFSATGTGTHSEGFVVKFYRNKGEPWVGNFQRGICAFNGAFLHPNRHDVLIVSGGQGYVIDPETRRLLRTIGGAIEAIYELEPLRLLVLDQQGLAFQAVGPVNHEWHTRRLSWDGFRNVKIHDSWIEGEGWDVIDEKWTSFTVDVLTGRSLGGAYKLEDGKEWERLAQSTVFS
jgi:hypothetical protein